MTDAERAARRRAIEASLGEEVPSTVDYPTWLKAQPDGIVERILGPARAREWRAGRYVVDRYIDPPGGPLTLGQLETNAERFGTTPGDPAGE
jgi:hypothetical protein